MTEILIVFIVSIITILSFYFSFINISKDKYELKPLIIILMLLGSVVTTALNYLGNALFKTLFTFIFLIIIFKIKAKKSYKEAFYYSMFIWIYGILIDLINLVLISSFGIMEILNNLEIIYIRLISTGLMAMCLFILSSLPFIKKFTNNTIKKLLKINSTIISDVFLIVMLMLLTVLTIANINKTSLAIFYVIISVIFVLFIYLIITKNYNIKRLKEVNNLLIKNNEFFIKLDTEHRILKHNLTNQLIGLKSVSNTKAKKYIDELIASYNSNFKVSKDINKIPSGINGLVYEKFYSFDNKDIKLNVQNSLKSDLLEVLRPKTFKNLCEIIGILIDNALEAAVDSADMAILIDFSESSEYINIDFSNTFKSDIDIEKIGTKGYSTKGDSHGIGLFSIFKKDDIKTKTRIINNIYQTNLKIKKFNN